MDFILWFFIVIQLAARLGPKTRVLRSVARTERAQMGDEKKERRKKAEDSGIAKRSDEKPERTRNKAELVSNVIAKIEAKLNANELKPTVGDFIRLLQLEKELGEEQPREIKVSWVEPDKKDAKQNAPDK